MAKSGCVRTDLLRADQCNPVRPSHEPGSGPVLPHPSEAMAAGYVPVSPTDYPVVYYVNPTIVAANAVGWTHPRSLSRRRARLRHDTLGGQGSRCCDVLASRHTDQDRQCPTAPSSNGTSAPMSAARTSPTFISCDHRRGALPRGERAEAHAVHDDGAGRFPSRVDPWPFSPRTSKSSRLRSWPTLGPEWSRVRHEIGTRNSP